MVFIEQRISDARIIPVIALDDAADAVPLCKALSVGGLQVAEITFRTAAAAEAIRIVAREFPEFVLGAGTVTRPEEVDAAVAAGAQFAVAPGCNPRIVRRAQEAGLPFFPGVCTPSDIEVALEMGCAVLKFFPADAMGGLKTVKALYAPYAHRGVRFIPTGGVTAENMSEYLKSPAVAAVGGTWLATRELVAKREWAQIADRTHQAVEAAAGE